MKAVKKMHYKKWKESQVKEIESFLKSHDTVAIADLNNLPASANRYFREILAKEGFKVKVSKLRVIKLALKNVNLNSLDKYVEGSVALIGGSKNPFTMYSTIKKNASSSSAKIGMIAPFDLYVPEGDTGIPPGPALSDFKAVGINTQIKNGKIYVPSNHKVLDEGKVITDKVVSILAKLNIKPIKVLMNVKGAYTVSDDILYDSLVLDIDTNAVRNNFISAYNSAFHLAMSRTYITQETIKPLIAKAFNSAKGVAISQNIVNKITAKDIIGKATRVAKNIKEKI